LVLYIEDEALLRELALTILGDAGFTVTALSTGEGAVELLETEGSSVRALVTDIDLGARPNGWEVATRARELFPDLPIIYVSGGSSHEWTSKGVPGSILLPKPFAAAQLVVAVSSAMQDRAGATLGAT
jgi:CheY-like chemotaxis protein